MRGPASAPEEEAAVTGWQPVVLLFPLSGLHVSIMQKDVSYHRSVTNH